MDQIKIGRFIAEMRKEQQLTQRQLSEQLDISDKTISKWETGKGLPEVSLMLPLCEILHINVNELLSGERLSTQEYYRKAEENMMNLVREKEESKKKLILSAAVAGLCTAMLLICTMISIYVETMPYAVKIFMAVFGVVAFVTGVGIAVVLDREAGTFECGKCGHRFTPDVKSYVMGANMITKRYLRCPKCGESSYCRHKLTH